MSHLQDRLCAKDILESLPILLLVNTQNTRKRSLLLLDTEPTLCLLSQEESKQ